MDQRNLDKILQDHKKWLNAEPGGRCAELRCADLRGKNLRRAVLSFADLRDADFRGADLRGADLRGTVLWDADFRGADLRGADLGTALTNGMKTDADTKINWPMECPETGSFIGWKKAGKYIVKLEIPEDAKRSSATTDRCRASMAKVLEIQNRDGTKANKREAVSLRGTTYKIGEMVYPDRWDNNRWNECSHGIHFFMTRKDAAAL